MNKYDIIDDRYRLLEYKGNDGERFGEVWLVEDLDRPGLELKCMVVSNQRFADKYILIRQLGSGGFGEVWKVYDTITKVNVALKIHKDGDNVNATNQIVKEYTRVMGIKHDNLLTPTHVNITGGRTAYLEMELCRKDLTDAELAEEEVWKLIHDVASGLKRLAENKKWIEKQQQYVDNPIIHQDIKPENILLRSNGMHAISDFGISKRKLSSLTTNETDSQDNEDSLMTKAYAAPERFPKGGGKSELASDIWSLGAMLYELVEGQLPFADYGGNSLNEDVVRIPTITRIDYSDELKQLIYDCMAKEPDTRPTAAQLQEYTEKAIAGDVRKVTWTGASKQIKSDPSKRFSQYKGVPWGKKKERSNPPKTWWKKKEPDNPNPPKNKNGFEYEEPATMYGAPSPFRRNIIKEIIEAQKKRLLMLLMVIVAMGLIVILYPQMRTLFDNAERKAWRSAKRENTLDSYKKFIESNGQSKYVVGALFSIVRITVADDNPYGLNYVMCYEDSISSGDKPPYNLPYTPGMEARDSVEVLCTRWNIFISSLCKKFESYEFDREYSQHDEQEYLRKMVADALFLDDIYNKINLFDEEIIDTVGRKNYSIECLNKTEDILYDAFDAIQGKLIKGISSLRDGERNAPEENIPGYTQARECVEYYFNNRRIIANI